jgi:hypothetical protein
MFTHTITRGYRDSSGVTLQSTETQSANGEENYDDSIPLSTTKQAFGMSLVRANLKMFMIKGDLVTALTVYARQAAAGAVAVAGVTNTNAVDAQINVVAHGWLVGQLIFVAGIGGATNLNGWYFVKVVVDADHVKISLTSSGSNVQGNGASYTSGGTVVKADVIQLAAGREIVWNVAYDSLSALPFLNDTDNFYVTNADPSNAALLKVRALQSV